MQDEHEGNPEDFAGQPPSSYCCASVVHPPMFVLIAQVTHREVLALYPKRKKEYLSYGLQWIWVTKKTVDFAAAG
jgi:hypothetical protein